MVASRGSTDAFMEPFTYRPDADEPLSQAVIAAVASVSDCRPTKSDAVDSSDVLPPLHDAIDPDALDALFRRHGGADADGRTDDRRGRVEFSYYGYRVTARSDGSVSVESQ